MSRVSAADSRGAAFLALAAWQKKPQDIVVVGANMYDAQRLYETVLSFLPEDVAVFFPADEILRSEAVSSSRELMTQRLYAMAQLRSEGPHILITHPAALLRYLPSPELFDASRVHFKLGDSLEMSAVRDRLLRIGYSRVGKVNQTLQFSIRGDILDVYSVNNSWPIRVEFFGDVIDSIRTFDPGTQISKKPLQKADVLPATDMIVSPEKAVLSKQLVLDEAEKEGASLSTDLRDKLLANAQKDIDDLSTGNFRPPLYRYYRLATGESSSIVNYLNPRLVIFADDDEIKAAAERLPREADDYINELYLAGLSLKAVSQYAAIDTVFDSSLPIIRCSKFARETGFSRVVIRPIVKALPGLSGIVPALEEYRKNGYRIVVSLGELHQREMLKGFLDAAKISFAELKDNNDDLPDAGVIGISERPLNGGFDFPDFKIVFLSSSDLFGGASLNVRYASKFKNATVLRSYEDLRPGDYVVHESYGIGRFVGIETIEADKTVRDYLKITYADDKNLYLPLEHFRLVRKYSGREGVAPKLSHLWSGEWERKKKHIKERVNELADRLIALYGDRLEAEGFAYPEDDDLQKGFEAEFPFLLTPDQNRSLEEIKKDMERPIAMDRLLCGDVGFGKTELAFRAAFKAMSAGKQVALLCPTTLLARQHFEVALQRFATYGIRVSQLSRLVSQAAQEQTLKEIEEGQVDLTIGTHRILSKDVKFKNLGLLIIDEEQRFGVEQKERIKELKASIDVLSLSATPIPRTLQMSLVGIRPISQINTPPDRRLPIETYVLPYDLGVCKELIERELSRKGQVFYVHNRVSTIYSKAEELSRLLPQAKIGVVHGQMDKVEAETTMERFYSGEVDVLVCSSIVENGIDVPNANLIIIEDADRLGLSQLYQIKGRVGRGNRVAYAYLMYKPGKKMNEDAQKRLQAIVEFTKLGSGYLIAQRDLMIRGAGDILGPEQAGFIDSVGLDLYLKMLHDAIENKKNPAKEAPIEIKGHVFSISAFIPSSYASDADKIELYQELENAQTEEEVDFFAKKARDVYGRVPPETEQLILKRRIDILSADPSYESIAEDQGFIDLRLSDSYSRINGIGLALFEELGDYLDAIRVTYSNKRLRIRFKQTGDWLPTLYQMMKRISSLYAKRIAEEDVVN